MEIEEAVIHRRLKAEVDNSLANLYNCPHLLFNQQAYLLDFLLSFDLFLDTISGYKQVVFFAFSSFAFLLFSFQFSSEIQLGWPRLETRLIDGLSSIPPRFQVIDQPCFPVNIPSNLWYIARILQIRSMLVGYEESVWGFAPIKNGEIF